MNRLRSAIVAILLLHTLAPFSVDAQVTGRVLESEVLLPVGGASVLALDTTFSVVQRANVDADGSFTFSDLAFGQYLFQATYHGRSGFISPPVVVGSDSVPAITLLIPSVMYELAMHCPESAGAILVGVVYETSGVTLPGARVALTWATLADSIIATTDAAGRYRFCRVPPETPVLIRITTLGRILDTEVELPSNQISRADFEVGLGIGASRLRVVSRTPVESSAGHGILSGVVRDLDSGATIMGAVVHLQGRDEPAVTTEDGAFRFIGTEPGQHLVELEHIAYGTQREVVALEPSVHLAVEFQVAPTAIVLDGIEAVGNAREMWERRANPERIDMLAGAELASEEARGGRITDVVATRFPSLKVSEGWFVSRYGGSRGVCMESIRRIMSLGPQEAAGVSGAGLGASGTGARSCNTIEVIVDDVRVQDPVGFLGTVQLGDFESISFMPAVSAGIRFGRDAGAHGGVLVLWTRGRGPYVSESRNTPPE